jgi:ABC-type branched-subunit amino acid transport system ATPase component
VPQTWIEEVRLTPGDHNKTVAPNQAHATDPRLELSGTAPFSTKCREILPVGVEHHDGKVIFPDSEKAPTRIPFYSHESRRPNRIGKILTASGGAERDVASLTSSQKLKEAGIAYILQDKSVFPGMTVEENLWMGGYLMDQPAKAKEAAERVFDKYPRLAERRKHQAKVLSGGERRLLEISRALVMNPNILLVDEPSIGLEPRFIDMVFEILHDLQHTEGKTILMVEQNAKKGLEFADIGYVLVSGELAMADRGDTLLQDPEVGRLFLGG